LCQKGPHALEGSQSLRFALCAVKQRFLSTQPAYRFDVIISGDILMEFVCELRDPLGIFAIKGVYRKER
jgi:hypothetical protein